MTTTNHQETTVTTSINLSHLDQDRPDEDLGLDDAIAALASTLVADGYPKDLADAVAEDACTDLIAGLAAAYETSGAGHRIVLTPTTDHQETTVPDTFTALPGALPNPPAKDLTPADRLRIHSNLCGLAGHAVECPFYEIPTPTWLASLQQARRLLRDVISSEETPDEVIEALAGGFARVDQVHNAILDGTL